MNIMRNWGLIYFKGHSKLHPFKLECQLPCVVNIHCPDSSVVEHLHGKQKVVGSIPILGRKQIIYNKKQKKIPSLREE